MITFSKLARAVFSGAVKGHFGQGAEDVLVRKLFPRNKRNGVYLDIGAYHPFIFSNTAWFWMKGWRGFNIDANQNTIKLFKKYRPADNNIWTAIIPNEAYERGVREVSLMLPNKSDNSDGVAATGTVHELVADERGFSRADLVPASSVSTLIDENKISDVDYLNIDIEGFDELILSEIDFSIISPQVITVEDFSNNLQELSNSKITKLIEANNYSLVGRTGITSVFLRNN